MVIKLKISNWDKTQKLKSKINSNCDKTVVSVIVVTEVSVMKQICD